MAERKWLIDIPCFCSFFAEDRGIDLCMNSAPENEHPWNIVFFR